MKKLKQVFLCVLLLSFSLSFCTLSFPETQEVKEEQIQVETISSPFAQGEVNGAYNPTLSYEYCTYAIASYCNTNHLQNWKCTPCRKYPNMIDINIFRNSSKQTAGFVGYQTQSKTIFVVFRGTLPWSIKDWIHDIDTFKTKYSGCANCEVHEGFYKAYLGLQDSMWNALNIVRNKHPDSQLVVTGHSLGGALAVLCAADFIQKNINFFSLYTYGGPRVGNPNFANWFTATFKNTYSRVTHGRDPVPHLPPESFGFRQSPQEIFYNFLNTKYQVCSATNGEDPKCSDKYLVDYSVVDHMTYMGYDFAYDVLACQ